MDSENPRSLKELKMVNEYIINHFFTINALYFEVSRMYLANLYAVSDNVSLPGIGFIIFFLF